MRIFNRSHKAPEDEAHSNLRKLSISLSLFSPLYETRQRRRGPDCRKEEGRGERRKFGQKERKNGKNTSALASASETNKDGVSLIQNTPIVSEIGIADTSKLSCIAFMF